ncbi:MAG: PVC-type heme-binding CxxCH protein, partial [Acidobacteriota bacterium]
MSFQILAFAVAVLAIGLIGVPAWAQSNSLSSLDPELERKTFKLLPGFEVNLFASEPMLANPIHMTWDAQGRLWVVCSWAYPQIEPGEEPNDKIIVLEDTDGDGRADKSAVFAEGLLVPTGLELGDGGVYVANAPDLLFLKDTDGDGKADLRRLVLSGFGTEDNHHAISAWRWGPGGWLYFQEGTFLHAQVETPHGLVRMENGGVFQFHPRTMRLNVFADYRASNPWGQMFDRWGQSILLDNPNIYFLAPLTANSRAKLAYRSIFRANTKNAGGDFVSGRHLPEEFRGELWTNAYKIHAINRYRIIEDGSGFSAKEMPKLLESTSQEFRPVDLKMGPDGAIYIADWYNPLIGHMQHEFRDPRRDNLHGRIWRITYKERPLLEKPKLLEMPVGQLLEQVKAAEDWTRYQVRRVLYDMDQQKATAALDRWVRSLDASDPGFDHHRLEALWCYQTIGVVEPELLSAVLHSRDGRARAAAVRVIRYWADRLDDPLGLLARAVTDEHPRVRLEAVLSLSFIRDPRSMVIAVRALDKPTDRFIDHALQLTADGLRPYWLSSYEKGKLKFDGAHHEAFALSMAQSSTAALNPLKQLLHSGHIDPQRLTALLQPLSEKGTAKELGAVLEMLTAIGGRGHNSQTVIAVLSAINRAARSRGVIAQGELSGLTRYLDHKNDTLQMAVMRLMGASKMRTASRSLLKVAGDKTGSMQVRAAAAQALGELADRQALEQLMQADQPIATRYLGLIGLAAIDVASAARNAAEAFSKSPGGADPLPLVAAILNRKGGADALAAALSKQPPHPQTAALIRRHIDQTGQHYPRLVEALASMRTSARLDQRLLAEDMVKLVADIRQHGDPARGEQIYRRPELACMSCHGIAGAGPTLGPDLAGIGASSPIDFIVDANLEPNKGIKDQFANVQVIGKNGRVYSGILHYQDNEQIILRDASQRGAQTVIPAANVEKLITLPSLMPPGLVNNLNSRREFLDLVRFLSELGKGPYTTPTRPIIRRWRVHHVDVGESAQLNPTDFEDDSEWKAAYSMVNGVLPSSDFSQTKGNIALVRGYVDVTTPGRVRLKLNSRKGLALWVDAKEVPIAGSAVVELESGPRALTFVVNVDGRRDLG